MNARYGNAANAYKTVANVSGALGSDPHKLVDMLYGGALEKIARAKGHLERHEIAAKGRCIGQAIDILLELQSGLRPEGGEITANLEALYDYMKRRLTEAHAKNDSAALDEVSELIAKLRDGWNRIPLAERQHARGVPA